MKRKRLRLRRNRSQHQRRLLLTRQCQHEIKFWFTGRVGRWRTITKDVSDYLSRSLQSWWFSLQIHHGNIGGGPVETILLFLWWLGDQLHPKGRSTDNMTFLLLLLQCPLLRMRKSIFLILISHFRRKRVDGWKKNNTADFGFLGRVCSASNPYQSGLS